MRAGAAVQDPPYLSLALCGADVGEKDRIMDTEVYGVEIALHVCRRRGNVAMRGLRYMDALRAFFARHEWCGLWDCARVTGYDAERMTVRVEREAACPPDGQAGEQGF